MGVEFTVHNHFHVGLEQNITEINGNSFNLENKLTCRKVRAPFLGYNTVVINNQAVLYNVYVMLAKVV